MDTYSQIQEIRSYYKFRSVDVDRYRIDGKYRQVMLAAANWRKIHAICQGIHGLIGILCTRMDTVWS